MKPLKFIINTDFATLKNDSNTISGIITVPAGVNIPSGVYLTYTSDIVVGTIGAPMECQLNYSAGTQRWVTDNIQVTENTFTANQYDGTIFIYRLNQTTARVQITYFNGTGGAVNTKSRTVSVTIRTFIPPFN